MAKKPWTTKMVDNKEGGLARKSRNRVFTTPFLTALLAAFFVIVLAILFVVFYTSNGGSNRAEETSVFYGAPSSSVATETEESKEEVKVEEDSESESENEEASSSQARGETITVLPGEGAASIAARAGISVEQLQELNPEHMTMGYWYANPGDAVYIN
ncbi:hypothetical protein SAMN02910293_02108 [Streptococcus henryi]|uniref:LysM domain-containing protein n=1 Tax=Streptococcus henryi TaxID=439219 RepID=A0A1G6DCJ1_9STRE|nr:SAG1386/EF1546 family surface-associated protein [Streptococcus henryi]SDB42841.1 hypothetical protein SAMN02910293_02108 [Streptococcus henryi]